MHAVAGVVPPAPPHRLEPLRVELGDLDTRLTRATGGARAALALGAAYRGERLVVLGFAGVRAVRSGAVSRLLGSALRLLEPWGEEGRIELRSLRPAVRRELLAWSDERDDVTVVAASRRSLLLAARPAAGRGESQLSTNRRRMLRLAARDGEHCVWCSRPLDHRSPEATVDHVRCRSAGGPDSLENLVLACAPCNHRRSNRSAELWLRHCLAVGLAVDEDAVARAIARTTREGRRTRRLDLSRRRAA